MVDSATYRQMHANVSPQRDDLGPESMELDEPPQDPFILLLPSTIRGFGMGDKKWSMLVAGSLQLKLFLESSAFFAQYEMTDNGLEQLLVEHIGPVQWNKDVFDRHLVLGRQKKDIIKALVTVHIASSSFTTTDIIEGKGKGLIILLHGGPGTGKTLTAESVAELAERPLYRVTCGDIGTDAEGVEKYLTSVLYIGTRWGCVVLLDEADVFLEERTQTDLQRNALVSVFLRVLEYYEGILILTTNRVGSFDEGFKSRVQLAMHYPSLDPDSRLEIWDNFVKMARNDGDDVRYDEIHEKIDTLARNPFNGREIRNIVNNARQLAKYRKESLAYDHFKQAIGIANEFQEYVLNMHGQSDEEWARSQRTRY